MQPRQLSEALHRLAGTDRLLVYDVPEPEAPIRHGPASPFVRGGPGWQRFIERRRALDDGSDLNLLISLRGLSAEERLLIVGWGTSYANAFLLIEPEDPWLDLTTAESITAYASAHSCSTAGDLLRTAYAEWVYWVQAEDGELESRAATLDMSDPGATFWSSLWMRLSQTFDQADYLSTLTLLNLREQELFTGGREVIRAMIPFLTRLGLPILYDWRFITQGMRQLINAGLATAQDPADKRVYRGPMYPLPSDLPDEQLAFMLR